MNNTTNWVALTLAVAFLTLLTLLTTGCGNSNGSSDGDDGVFLTDTGQDSLVAQMRFVNAIPDSPVIEMLHEGTNSARITETLTFGASTNRNNFVTGTFVFDFSFVNGAGDRITLYENDQFELADGNEHSFIMAGSLNDARLIRLDNPEFLVGLDDDTADVDPQIQFIHTAVGVGDIDFYLTEQGADITQATPLATLAFGENSAIFDTVATDTAQLRAFEAGSSANLLFDSGATTISRTTRTLILAANYFGPLAEGASAVELRRLGQTPLALENASQPATLRIHNVIADQQAIDVYLGDRLGAPDIAAVEFSTRTDELQLAAQTTDLSITAAGDVANVLLEMTDLQLTGGFRTTVYLGGDSSVVSDSTDAVPVTNVTSEFVLESNREVLEGSPIRLFNGSSSLSALSVFLLRPGQDLANTAPIMLAPGGYTGVPVFTGDFDLVVVDTSNNSTIIGPERITPTAGTALNIVIRDTFGGTSPVQVDLVEEATQGL